MQYFFCCLFLVVSRRGMWGRRYDFSCGMAIINGFCGFSLVHREID